jgi:FlaA1/EpsC-like NDP-sugar epimerase
MKKKDLLALYFKSTLNLVLLTGTVLSGIALYLLLNGWLKMILPLAVLFLYIAITVVLLLTRGGAGAILRTQHKAREEQYLALIAKYKQVRAQVSFLRIGSEPVNKAIQYFLQISGDYLHKCEELKTYSPEANHKMDEVYQVCQIFLEEKDESSTEKRYSIEDKNDFTDYETKTVETVTRAANLIKDKMNYELHELTRKEQMEIIEEMDNNQ